MSKNITIYDVAEEAGVSLATVSRVINNSPKVKEATKIKVNEIITKLNYKPNAIAQGLAVGRSTSIGVYVPEISRLSVAQVVQGIIDIADIYKYSIVLETSKVAKEKTISIDTFISKQVDGLIIISDELSSSELESLKSQSRVPVVLVSANDVNKEIPTVHIDFEKATYQAVEKFIENGSKKILYVSSSLEGTTNNKREKGYKEAMKKNNLQPNIIEFNKPLEFQRKEATSILKNNDYDAVLCSRDSIALAFLNASYDLKLSVPKDLEIIGFDDTNYSQLGYIPLTTISYSIYDLGAVAMRLLTKCINNEEIENNNIVLPHYLKERNSTR